MIILFGLAGSGKGTQGAALAQIFGLEWLSVGEAIRRSGKYDAVINGGNMIPDADVTQMMDAEIAAAVAKGREVVLDGYPRNVVQAKYVAEHYDGKIEGAIILEVPKEELYERLALRARDDDKERASIDRRFAVFEQNIGEIVQILSAAKVPVGRVNGVGAVEAVTERLVTVVKSWGLKEAHD